MKVRNESSSNKDRNKNECKVENGSNIKNNYNKKCRASGITLIALVVTIVVMLVLAGVSISMLTGDNGVIAKSKETKITATLSSYVEQYE
jgi:flagellar basal body-associated protein FliL